MEDYKKKYEEALGMAEEIIRYYKEHNRGDETSIEDLEQIFPELKNEDEKIRKALVDALNKNLGNGIEKYGTTLNAALTWLEKQGNIDLEFFENSENEKREFVGYGFLKCKGDFLSFKEGENYWLEYVGKDNYNVRSDNLLGQTFHITPQQLYTVFRPTTWLEKQCQTFTKKDVDDAYLKGICDAKHELKQQDEYELVAKKADDEIEIPFGAKDSELQEETYFIPKGFHAEIDDDKVVIKKGEKPATWSDEDEGIVLSIKQVIKAASLLNIVPEKLDKIDKWLNSIKHRVQPQLKEWSDEDEKMYINFKHLLDQEKLKFSYTTAMYNGIVLMENWLKSIKNRIGG